MHGFDDAVGQDAGGDALELFAGEFSGDQVGAAGADFFYIDAHVADGHFGGGGYGVHDAGFEVDFDSAVAVVVGRFADDLGGFDDGVGEEVVGDLIYFLRAGV